MIKVNQTQASPVQKAAGRNIRASVLLMAAVLGWSGYAQAFGPSLTPPPPPGTVVNQIGNAAQGAVATVDQFFGSIKNKTIDGAHQIDNWKNDASRAAAKKVADFTACPSPDAQNLYNDLKKKRSEATRTRDAARKADQDAQNALNNCKRSLPELLCRQAYDPLPFKGYAEGAQVAINELSYAMNILTTLKCPAGCDKPAVVVYPTLDVQRGNPITPSMEVCTDFDPGSFTASFGESNGELKATQTAKLPKCRKTARIAPEFCSRWDVNALLPQLKGARVVPDQVNLGDISVNVPSKKIRIVDAIETVPCGQSVNLCTRLKGNVTLNFDTGADPLQILNGVPAANCAQSTTIACTQPPFGVGAHWKDIDVPDLEHVKLGWSGMGFKPGSIEINVQAGKFDLKCAQTKRLSLPTPRFEVVTKRADLGVCLLPRLVPVVANP